VLDMREASTFLVNQTAEAMMTRVNLSVAT